MSQSTLVQSPSVVKTDAENVAAFADVQVMAHKALVGYRAQYPNFSLTYEDVLPVYVQTFEEAGYDFTGMWPTDSFDAWVAQHEADFGDMADYAAAVCSRCMIEWTCDTVHTTIHMEY